MSLNTPDQKNWQRWIWQIKRAIRRRIFCLSISTKTERTDENNWHYFTLGIHLNYFLNPQITRKTCITQCIYKCNTDLWSTSTRGFCELKTFHSLREYAAKAYSRNHHDFCSAILAFSEFNSNMLAGLSRFLTLNRSNSY